jgi:GT2 family glycosyltransferase
MMTFFSVSAEPPLVSIVVVNHNRDRLLRDCVRSLSLQTYPRFEVVIVDNASSDDSCEYISSLKDARFQLVSLKENLGFGGGCNVGIKQARGELIALLNNDAVAVSTWLSSLVSAMSEPRMGMCASKILFADSNVIDKVGHLIFFDGQNRGRGTGEQDCGQYENQEETIFPDGCAALYRRSMLEEAGGFDEDFFAYADDSDLGLRGRLLGWKCNYVPEAVVFHRHSSTTGSYSLQKIYWVERNRLWLAVKCFPTPLLLLNPIFTCYRWGWNLLAAFLGRGSAGNFRRRHSFWVLAKTICRANWDGLKDLNKFLGKRRDIRKRRCLNDLAFYRLIWRFRISARVLAIRDR